MFVPLDTQEYVFLLSISSKHTVDLLRSQNVERSLSVQLRVWLKSLLNTTTTKGVWTWESQWLLSVLWLKTQAEASILNLSMARRSAPYTGYTIWGLHGGVLKYGLNQRWSAIIFIRAERLAPLSVRLHRKIYFYPV